MKTLMMAAALIVLCSTALRAQQEQLGAGVVVGNPTALTMKYYVTNAHAIDGGVGEFAGDFTAYADYLWHDWAATSQPKNGKVGFYLGLGGQVRNAGDGAIFGLRTVGGGAFRFAPQPVELFAEIAPVFELLPSSFVQLDGGLGVRVFFSGGK